MSVSGNEKSGVTSRHPSIPSAGIPIKKRRIPSWVTSSPPREQSSVENRQSSPSRDSSIMNHSVVTTTSPGNSDASKGHLLEVKKESVPDHNSSGSNSVNFPETKLQEPNINFGLGTEENVDSKEKVLIGLKRAHENNPSPLELHLAPKEAPSVRVGKASPVEKLSAISEDSGLSLGPQEKEPLVSSLSGLRTDGTHKLKDFDAASLSLSLSKEKRDTPCGSRDVDLQRDDSLIHSNRFNWDLNTTMDAWEDSVDGSAVPETVTFDGLTGKDAMNSIKPNIGLLGVADSRGKQILESGEHRSSLGNPSSTQHCKSDHHLRLSLGNSFSQSKFRQNVSALSNSVASHSILSNVKSPGVLIPAGASNVVGHPIVKSEPCDEKPENDQSVVKDRHTGPSDLGTAEMESVVRRNVEASMVLDKNSEKANIEASMVLDKNSEKANVESPLVLDKNSEKAVLPTLVKSEPVSDGKKEACGMVTQNSVAKNVPPENLSPIKAIPSQSKHSCLSDIPNSESSGAVQKESQVDIHRPPATCKRVHRVALESNSVHEEIKERNTQNAHVPEDTRSDRCEQSGSDDERVNISNDMLEDDSYGYDYDSDGNQVPVSPTPKEPKQHGENDDNVYGDTRVSESLASDKEVEKVISPEKDIETDGSMKMNEIDIKECIENVPSMKTEEENRASDEQRPTEASELIDESRRDGVLQGANGQDFPSGGTITGGQNDKNTTNFIGNDTGNDDSTLPTASKDPNSGGNRSRIINLPRDSPLKAKPFPDGSFGRERFDGEKPHPQRTRDEFYSDGPRKFVRGRFRGQTFRNFRPNYGRGRGRGYGRSDWHADRPFMPENFNGPSDFRFPRRNKELECNGYGDLVGSGRGGRKPLNDEFPPFRRGGPGLRRVPRNFSPNRCVGEDGEGFMRGMADDMRDPMFTRPPPPPAYEGLDFIRGNRNFPPGQKRGGGPPRVRSKSPESSRPWSPPPQRSPDGFNGNPDFAPREPPVFRMVGRRHGSPPFTARPMDVVGRPYGPPRPILPNRNTRRFEGLDGRERTENDHHVTARPGRFPDGGGRSFTDRHGGAPRRDGDGEGSPFRCHMQDGPPPNRPFRLCSEPDSELVDHNSPRDREFDRRVKNRPRPRPTEDQDGGEPWTADGFDHGSHGKRRRF